MSTEAEEKQQEKQEQAQNGNVTTKPKCEVCLEAESKYKCPRCLVKTCSLACCNKHKADTGCNGKEDRTKYVPKEEFDESLVLSDYRFLEEQARIINNFQRQRNDVKRLKKPHHKSTPDKKREDSQ